VVHLVHHNRELKFTPYGVVHGRPNATDERGADGQRDRDAWTNAACAWLAARLRAWPVFIAVGTGRWSRVHQTGYSDQWLVKTTDSRDPARRVYRRAGEFPSRVALSWREVPAGALFLDPGYWPIVLNSVEEAPDGTLRVRPISRTDERLLLKPGWDVERWLRRARRGGESVEAVVAELDLRTADEVWCRNHAARAELIARGFAPERVRAVRVPVRPWP
jgi:hypothetical protein